jgi:hypothetical protein
MKNNENINMDINPTPRFKYSIYPKMIKNVNPNVTTQYINLPVNDVTLLGSLSSFTI